MRLYKFTGIAEVYNSPFPFLYRQYTGPRRVPVNITELAEDELEAMRAVARIISSIYSDDWLWVWWKAEPLS